MAGLASDGKLPTQMPSTTWPFESQRSILSTRDGLVAERSRRNILAHVCFPTTLHMPRVRLEGFKNLTQHVSIARRYPRWVKSVGLALSGKLPVCLHQPTC